MELLKTDGVSKVFGGLKAVSNLILEESVGIHRKIVDFSQSTMIE